MQLLPCLRDPNGNPEMALSEIQLPVLALLACGCVHSNPAFPRSFWSRLDAAAHLRR